MIPSDFQDSRLKVKGKVYSHTIFSNLCLFSDVIWYKIDEGDLTKLEDSEFYEVSHEHNKHTLTIFNPSRAIAGQYMCMAINDKGHCSQYLIVNVKSKDINISS